MKKLIFIFILALFLPVSAHPFWIWSGKDKKLKNPAAVGKLSPAFRLQDGIKQFERKRFKKATVIFRALLKKYPDAYEAAEAQYYLGRCAQETNHLYEAYLSYQKVVDAYPNSKRINEVLDREYNIGETLMSQSAKSILGFTKYDFVEHPSIEIFKKITEKTANVTYAAKSQYQLGLLYSKLNRYDEAREAFTRVIDKYPDSEWLAPAKYQLAQATAKGFTGTDYDVTPVTEAASRLDEFVSNYSDSDVAPQAAEHLKQLNNEDARKNYETGAFYERLNKFKAAKIYYAIAVDKYPETPYGQKAGQALERIDKKL